MRRTLAVVVATALFVGCAAPSADTAATSQRTIEIQMTEFAFSPSRILLRPGERVTLKLKNLGGAEHELMAGTGSMPGAGFMQDWLGMASLDATAGDHMDGHMGASIRVPAKGTATISIVVPPQVGEIEFGCFIADHYERGMHGVLVIDQGRAPNAVPTVPPGSAKPASGPTGTPMPHPSGGMDDEQH